MSAEMGLEGKKLWEPSRESIAKSELTRYAGFLKEKRGLALEGWEAIWSWSVTDLDAFWRSIADFFEVRFHAKPRAAITDRNMPGTKWFEGATLNYAEAALARRDGATAIVHRREDGLTRAMTYAELHRLAARARAGLDRL